MQALDAVSGHIDHVGMFSQALAHVGGSLGFVFDDQDSHGWIRRDGFRSVSSVGIEEAGRREYETFADFRRPVPSATVP